MLPLIISIICASPSKEIKWDLKPGHGTLYESN